MVRKSRHVETRLVAEYLKATYSGFTYITGQPLGLVSQQLLVEEGFAKGLRMQRPNRPEVDAVVLHPKLLILIEAKVREILNGLAKLPFYMSLVPFTPELKEYAHLPILMELVAPLAGPNHEIMASEAGIRIVKFRPAWIDEYVAEYQHYWTREYRLAREEKLRNRELLGLE